MAKNQYVSGVGGWLGLLVVGLTILGPLIGLGKMSNEFRDAVEQFPQLADNAQWQNYKQISWLIFTASSVISFSAGYRLWKIHFPESVRFAILALWLAGPLGNVLYVIAAVVIFGNNAGGDVVTQMIGGILSSVITAGIWTAYLSKSQRVRNTYQYQVNEVSSDGITPLMMAAMLGKTKQIPGLITAGANIDAIDERGWTALMYAASRNEVETVEFLLKYGASPVLKNNENQTAAEIAQSKQFHEAVAVLQN